MASTARGGLSVLGGTRHMSAAGKLGTATGEAATDCTAAAKLWQSLKL